MWFYFPGSEFIIDFFKNLLLSVQIYVNSKFFKKKISICKIIINLYNPNYSIHLLFMLDCSNDSNIFSDIIFYYNMSHEDILAWIASVSC